MRSGSPAHLPAFWVLTDPVRTPDPVAVAERLPVGSGLIYRHFGSTERFGIASQLRDVTRFRGCRFLVSADPELARLSHADGLHWPENCLAQIRYDQRWGLQTTSAHSITALHRAQARDLDAVFCSSIFPSASPTAGRPLGPFRLAAWARATTLPVFALGGVNARTIRRLDRLGIQGVGVVGAAAL